MSFTHISLGPWTTFFFFFLISKKDVYLKSCFMSTQLKKKKAALCKKGSKQIKGYKNEKRKRTKKEINYKEKEN